MRVQIWAPLSAILLLTPLTLGNIRLHHSAHKQPDMIDPRNHYYFEAKAPLPAIQANSTALSSTSANATRTHHGRDAPISTTAGGSLPTTSTGALRCGPDFPCLDGGCCGANNLCGFGPSYCGTGCQSQCNATAPCGRDSAGGSQACGMNLCCSYYGWCGVDANYCTPPPKRGAEGCQVEYSDCRIHQPLQCDPLQNSATKRTIAYYQGGNVYPNSRACDQTRPSDLKTDNYTHLYWAFAVIDPSSHELVPSDKRDVGLYKDFTDLKKPGKLETWISVGGFDFVTANPAAWSSMVATPQSRSAFIKSAASFMAVYGFQGIDLDWEYPVDPKRGGQPNDMANLIQLLADMRADPVFSQNYGISVTLAPDIWYLQHFDAKGLLRYASWLGFMAYDLHGIWDANVPRVGMKVYGHTNLNDISRDLIPLWYDLNAADMSRVNLGLALYGRGYTLQDSGCTKADGSCAWIRGNDPGACTGEEGILSRSEIDQIIKDKHLTPTNLDDGSGFTLMKQITWDDQWVGYDDDDTIRQKTYFASSHCFGGTMAWSIDLGTHYDDDTGDDGTSGDGFPGKAAGQKCHWSNCGFPPNCADGETAITTRQGTCDAQGPTYRQALCCPDSTPLHDCNWRGDSPDCNPENGECGDCVNTQCQMGEQFVINDKQGDAQWSCPGPASPPYGPQRSLCCHIDQPTIGTSHSLVAPPQCTLDGQGSWWQSCQKYAQGLMRERQAGFCQNDDPGANGCTKHSFEACEIEICGANHGTTYNCGIVGLALQELVTNCSRSYGYVGGTTLLRASGGDGSTDQTIRIRDIDPSTVPSKRSPDNSTYIANMNVFLPRDDYVSFPPNKSLGDSSPFGLAFAAKMGQANSVNTQESVEYEKNVAMNLANGERHDTKSLTVVAQREDGTVTRLAIMLLQGGLYIRDILRELPIIIQGANDYRNDLGNPSSFGMMLVERPYYRSSDYLGIVLLQNDDDPEEVDPPPAPNPQCQGEDLCATGDFACDDEPFGNDFDPNQPPSKRSVLDNSHDELGNITQERGLEVRVPWNPSGRRANPYSYRCNIQGGRYAYGSYSALVYPTYSQWTKNDPRYSSAYATANNNFCISLDVDTFKWPTTPKISIVTEHIFELQTPQKFFESVTKNQYMDGSMGLLGNPIYCDFFGFLTTTNALSSLPNPPPIPPGSSANILTPMERIRLMLGSKDNYFDFVFLEYNINSYKARMWQWFAPNSDDTLRKWLRDDNQHSRVLTAVRNVFNVVSYLNQPAVNYILMNQCNGFREELYFANKAWMQNGHPDTEIVAFWDEWIRNFLDGIGTNAQKWSYSQVYTLRGIWTPRTSPQDKPRRNMVLNTCSVFDGAISTKLKIKRDGLTAIGT